jgi:hypothetical protein
MSALKLARALAALVATVAVPGCAVLTIDVDVYKGPLINSERMKMEQITAMSVAAKPLLLQLRSTFELECKNHWGKQKDNRYFTKTDSEGPNAGDCLPDWKMPVWCPQADNNSHAVSGACLGSWQARRVNAILYLYQDAGTAGACLAEVDLLMTHWMDALRQTKDAIFRKGEDLKYRKPGDPRLTWDFALIQDRIFKENRQVFSEETRKLVGRDQDRDSGKSVAGPVLQNPGQLRAARNDLLEFVVPDPQQRAALLRALNANGRALWLSVMRSLTDRDSRLATCSDAAGARNLAADLAATLTDRYELTYFLEKNPNARQVAGKLIEATAAEPLMKTALDLPKDASEFAFSARIVSALKKALLGPNGQAVAEELLDVQNILQSDANPGGLAASLDAVALVHFQDGLATQLQAIATGFEQGRRSKGLLTLTRDYMESDILPDRRLESERGRDYSKPAAERLEEQLRDNRAANRALKRRLRNELLDVMTDFGQKVAHMANLQPLLPSNKDDKGKRIQLLQAIGNSILNQVDDFKKLDEYQDRSKDRKLIEAELAGQRSARRSMSGAIVSELVLEVTKAPGETSRKAGIIEALAQGDAKLRDAQKLIAENSKEANKAVEELQGKAGQLTGAAKSLKDTALPAKVKEAVKDETTDEGFTAKARKALADFLDARVAEEKKKPSGGNARDYEGGKFAYDQVLSKGEALKKGTAEADVVKAWQASIDEAIEKAGKDLKAAEGRAATMKNWLGRAEAALSASLQGPEPRSLGDFETVVDVFDDVLRELEYARVIAARAGLKPQLEQIDHALTLARQRRAEMLYVRPASLYLRDSYPATVLQQSPANSGAVPNLIWQKLRNAFFQEDSTEDLAVKEQVDKQFWQTINQIRLGGGGKTNYVVAKDDLGNWYVKGYENDLTSIIEATKGLASYAIGAKLQTNLFKPGKDGAELTPFGKQVKKATDDYQTSVRDTVREARKTANGIKQSYESEYGKLKLSDEGKKYLDANKDSFIKAPGGAIKAEIVVEDAADDKKSLEKIAGELPKLLGAFVDYFKGARSGLDSVVVADKKANGSAPRVSDDDYRALWKVLWQFTRAEVDSRVAEIEKAGTKLESRITLINELLDAAAATTATAEPAKTQ